MQTDKLEELREKVTGQLSRAEHEAFSNFSNVPPPPRNDVYDKVFELVSNVVASLSDTEVISYLEENELWRVEHHHEDSRQILKGKLIDDIAYNAPSPVFRPHRKET